MFDKNIRIRSFSNKDSVMSNGNRNKKVKKIVSFQDADKIRTGLGQYKLFYRSGTFDKNTSVKSILKVKRSTSTRSNASSLITLKDIRELKDTKEAKDTRDSVKKLSFKNPIEQVKHVDSISKYLKSKEKIEDDHAKANCICACIVF